MLLRRLVPVAIVGILLAGILTDHYTYALAESNLGEHVIVVVLRLCLTLFMVMGKYEQV